MQTTWLGGKMDFHFRNYGTCDLHHVAEEVCITVLDLLLADSGIGRA